ncbi:methyl-accepting chemotaxis protein [Comamonas terrae]|uniref:Methyl-accepting chemotaxis protein n=1 Tax=Comamonas terrae TaxID=673548 RepID=A0ABW5UT78_9BURK|nr:methyl-accepting chemotaxis protein [Comamonas terrae]
MLSTLRARMLVSCTAIVAVALALTGGATYYIVRGSSLDAVEQNLAAVANGHALAVDEWVASRSAMVEAAVQALGQGDAGTVVRQLEQSGGFRIVTAGWQDRTAVSSKPTPPGFDPTSRPWYKEAVAAGKLLVTKPYADANTGKAMVSFAAPLLKEGRPAGAVSAAVFLDGVREVVAAVHPTPSSFGFVVDGSGQLLAHPNAELMRKPASTLSDQLTPQTMAALAKAQASIELVFDGVPKLLRAKPVRGTDWSLVVALDRAEATEGLAHVFQTSVAAIVLVAFGAAVAVGLLTARAFRRLSEVRDAMNEIGSGDGDLSRRLPVHGQDEVAQIAAAFNRFVEKIAAVLHEIREGSESLQQATVEIEAGNQDLSRRTEVAAGQLQQTASAMEQLVGNVRQSAEAAQQARRLAGDASEVAAQGGAVVGQVVATMEEISNGSRQIAEITGVIDSLAFQTNILALNAAVEAARAGEQGRGFAVVAGEVRQLAQRSAQAAKDIRGLIGSSVEKVEMGASLVNNAGKTMNDIVRQVERVSSLIGEITRASTEQREGMVSVGEAVRQLDDVTQQNAALVEQSAAAAESLRQQTGRLARTVGVFKLGGGQPQSIQALVQA